MSILKIISWNVNGIRAAHKKGLVDFIKKENPDIICLQETKAFEEQLPEDLRNIEGYELFINPADPEIKKGYSGVAIYTKLKPNKEIKNKLGSKSQTEKEEYFLLNLMILLYLMCISQTAVNLKNIFSISCHFMMR